MKIADFALGAAGAAPSWRSIANSANPIVPACRAERLVRDQRFDDSDLVSMRRLPTARELGASIADCIPLLETNQRVLMRCDKGHASILLRARGAELVPMEERPRPK